LKLKEPHKCCSHSQHEFPIRLFVFMLWWVHLPTRSGRWNSHKNCRHYAKKNSLTHIINFLLDFSIHIEKLALLISLRSHIIFFSWKMHRNECKHNFVCRDKRARNLHMKGKRTSECVLLVKYLKIFIFFFAFNLLNDVLKLSVQVMFLWYLSIVGNNHKLISLLSVLSDGKIYLFLHRHRNKTQLIEIRIFSLSPLTKMKMKMGNGKTYEYEFYVL
jgi:hypothetical protein